MNRQRGVSISGFLLWGVAFALCAGLVMKLFPVVLEYYTTLQDVKAVAASSRGLTVSEIRKAYGKYVDIDQLTMVAPTDLDISKDGDQVVIAFAYEARVPLFANVSLLIDFQASSSGRKRGE
jgi:hypothetical protein